MAQTVGSKFTVKEVTTYNAVLRLGCLSMYLYDHGPMAVADTKTLDLISGLVDQQRQEGLDKLDLMSVVLLQGHDSFVSLLKTSKDWKIQTISARVQEFWTALVSSAPSGHIGTMKLSIYKGSGEKVCKEDVKKVWESWEF